MTYILLERPSPLKINSWMSNRPGAVCAEFIGAVVYFGSGPPPFSTSPPPPPPTPHTPKLPHYPMKNKSKLKTKIYCIVHGIKKVFDFK